MYDPDRHPRDPNKWVKRGARLFGKGLFFVCLIVATIATVIYAVIWAWAWGKLVAPFVLVCVVVWVLYLWADSVTPEEDDSTP